MLITLAPWPPCIKPPSGRRFFQATKIGKAKELGQKKTRLHLEASQKVQHRPAGPQEVLFPEISERLIGDFCDAFVFFLMNGYFQPFVRGLGMARMAYLESHANDPDDASWPGGGGVATWKGWKDTESWNNKNSESWKVSNDSWKAGPG